MAGVSGDVRILAQDEAGFGVFARRLPRATAWQRLMLYHSASVGALLMYAIGGVIMLVIVAVARSIWSAFFGAGI